MNPFVLDLIAKVSFILVVGLFVAGAMRAAAPSVRHLVLSATIASTLALPVVMLLSPRWDIPLLPASEAASASGANAGSIPAAVRSSKSSKVPPTSGDLSAQSAVAAHTSIEPQIAAASPGLPLTARSIALVWALGFTVVIGWLVAGRIRLHRIGKMSWGLTGDEWTRMLGEECHNAGVDRTVQLCSSSIVSTPLTWGWRAPIILLPEDALDWPEDHRRIVLRHELAHVARSDALSQLLAGFVCALYWFHPLVWVTERRLRAECERACDDKVVAQGTPAPEYAAHLLEVARSARAFGAPGFLSVAMARPSQLEGRLLAVLNGSRARAAVSRTARSVAIAGSLLVLLSLAAFRPVPKPIIIMSPKAVQLNVSAPIAMGPGSSMPRSSGSANSTALAYRLDSTVSMNVLVRSGGTLDLDLKTGGEVTISGSDRSDVSVRGSLGGRDWRRTEVRLVTTDGGARLESYFRESSNNQSTRHRFDISVPRNFNVQLRSSGGSLSIENVTGTFTGSTGGGEINIRGASGRADLSTGGGDIYVSDSKLAGNVSTGGGMVRFIGVDGNVKGASGSGPVIYSNSTSSASAKSEATKSGKSSTTYTTNDGRKQSFVSSGGITMNSGGGAISVPSAPDGAHVTTGGGRIRIGPSGGQVYAVTGGGDIDVGPATGSVEAVTGAGDVSIELKGADSHSVRVTSGTGEVDLIVPANLNATLELETAYTNRLGHKTQILSDFPVSVTETSAWDDTNGTPRRYVRVRQNIGRGGAVIKVRTVNGNIRLRRGG
jgi:beta-lactamase regulating signal transducer with metallopeptidase domain